MRIVVGRHLDASTAVRTSVEKSIELIALEDVAVFLMNFLERGESIKDYLILLSIASTIHRGCSWSIRKYVVH